jgi:putative membrane protein
MFAPASAASARRLTAEQRDEWRFLKEAAAASRFESDASRLALARSKDPAVRALAASLIEHHASAVNMLDHMLRVRSMAAPMLANDQRKTLNRLSKLQGRKFDREYVEVALRSQQGIVSTFDRAALVVQDPALKAWIERTLPSLRTQLASAERIAVHADPRANMTSGMTSGVTSGVTGGPAQHAGSRLTARNTR